MRTTLIIVAVAAIGIGIFIYVKKAANPFSKLGTPPPTTKDCGALANFFSGHVGRKNAVAPTVISNYTGADKKTAEGIAEIAGKFDVSAYAENYIGEKLAGWLCGKDFGDILSGIGGGIVDGFKAVGGGIKDAAEFVGGGIAAGAEGVKDAAVFVGKGVASGAKAVGSGVATGAKAVGKAATSDTGKALATGGVSLLAGGVKSLFGGSAAPPKDADGNFLRTTTDITKPGATLGKVTGKTRTNTEKVVTGAGFVGAAKTPAPPPPGTPQANINAVANQQAAQAAAASARAGNVPVAPPKTGAGTTTFTRATTIAPAFSNLGKKML